MLISHRYFLHICKSTINAQKNYDAFVLSRGCLDIKLPSDQVKNYHYKGKMVSWLSYLYNGNPCTQKDGLYIETGPSILTFYWLPFCHSPTGCHSVICPPPAAVSEWLVTCLWPCMHQPCMRLLSSEPARHRYLCASVDLIHKSRNAPVL